MGEEQRRPRQPSIQNLVADKKKPQETTGTGRIGGPSEAKVAEKGGKAYRRGKS